MNLNFLRPFMQDPDIVNRVKIHITPVMFPGYIACTIGHHVFMLPDLNELAVMSHEIKHIEQIEQYGFIRFYVDYFYQFLALGYKNISYEIVARQFAKNVLEVINS